MAKRSKRFDAAKFLETEEALAGYLNKAIETENMNELMRSIGIIAKARGMTRIAKETGLSRENLYKSLSNNGNPQFETVVLVLKALGLRLSVEPEREEGDVRTA
jgi:probable addiction module antidote protein